MTGYRARTIRIDLSEFSGDPEQDPLWVVIKNPVMLPDNATRASNAGEIQLDEQGRVRPESRDAALAGMKEVICRLVVGWRVYDATVSPEVDPDTGAEVPGTGQVRLPQPSGGNGVSVADFEKLPAAVQLRLIQEYGKAVNPLTGQGEQTTQSPSSGPLNPSSTEPGGPGSFPTS